MGEMTDEARLEAILDVIQEGVWEWNCRTGEVKRSPSWYRMLGYSVNSKPATVMTWEDVIHPQDYPVVMDHFTDYLEGRRGDYSIEYRCKKADGSFLWVHDQGRVVQYSEDGSPALMIGAHLDIQARKLSQQALEAQNKLLSQNNMTLENLLESMINNRTKELVHMNQQLESQLLEIETLKNLDHLTAIFNRRKMELELQREIDRSKRYQSPLGVVLFDLDNFKQINDTCGHQVGDRVLQEVTALVKQHIRTTDVFGRWGGDEFMIILPGLILVEVEQVIQKILVLLGEAVFVDGVSVSCSFGLTEIKADDDLSSLYKRVDQALYQAKFSGKNFLVSLSPTA